MINWVPLCQYPIAIQSKPKPDSIFYKFFKPVFFNQGISTHLQREPLRNVLQNIFSKLNLKYFNKRWKIYYCLGLKHAKKWYFYIQFNHNSFFGHLKCVAKIWFTKVLPEKGWETFTALLYKRRSNPSAPWSPFGLFKGQIIQICPFLKRLSRKKMIWPFGHFLAFFKGWRK